MTRIALAMSLFALLLIAAACGGNGDEPEAADGEDETSDPDAEDDAAGDEDAEGADDEEGEDDEDEEDDGEESEGEEPDEASEDPPDEIELTMGMLPASLSNAGIYIAQDKGYFEDQGISLDVEEFRSGDAQTSSLARGDLQIASGGPNAGFYNAIGRDVGAKIVADKGYGNEEFDWAQYVTRPELEDEIQSIADLEGRPIAMVGEGASQEVGLSLALEAEGLSLDDVDPTIMPFPEMEAALAGESVDAIYVIETFLTRITSAGNGVAFASPTQHYPEQQHAVVFYSEAFIEEEPEAAEGFMVAYIQGMRDYNDAFMHDEGREEVDEILVNHGVVEDAALLDEVNLVGLNPDGYALEESIATDIDFYDERGYLEVETDVEEVVDHSFVDQALETLGEYEE